MSYHDESPRRMRRRPVHDEDRGGFWTIALNVLTFTLFGVALCLVVQYLLWGESPTEMVAPVPTAQVQYQPRSAPAVPAFAAPVAPAAPVDVQPLAPAIAPAAPVAPALLQDPEIIREAAPSCLDELPAPGPAISLIPEVAPEGGVPPAEVSSQIDPNWRCNVFGDCEGGE
jgi:hypothetical protein